MRRKNEDSRSVSTPAGPADAEQTLQNLRILDGPVSESNLQQVESLVKDDWPLSCDIRQELVNQMVEILRMADDPKVQIAAARVLLAADALNQRTQARLSSVRSDNSAGRGTNIAIGCGSGSQIQIYIPENGRDG